ncbi:hypothetical protein [Salinisphaera sp.]|uniref:hypothetical protein n=1 Tax=Salinisphaera sp. TaxID=1914330 RepID=UPI000C5D0A0F|nr:hypothetical protein [Salinisphaera sp.]MBS64597.1 hypothetical protein [Salinisphaera sp.]
MKDLRDSHVPAWFWVGVPVVLYFGHYLLRAATPFEFFDRYILHESGATEQGTVLVLVLALLTGLLVLSQLRSLGDKRLLLFFGLFCLGCIYFGGEEASWGQHWMGWDAPDSWASLNNQNETNLHNSNGLAGSLLDQLPRNLLTLAALIGGAIIPLVRRARGKTYERGSFAYWIMPGMACVPAGLIAAFSSIPQKISESVAGEVVWPMDINAGEVKELMIATFLFVYIATVWIRLRNRQGGSARPATQ